MYNPTVDDSGFGDFIKNIRRMLNANRNFSVHTVSRQANKMAHLMARHSRTLTCPLAPDFLISCMNNYCNPTSGNETNGALMDDGNAGAH